MTFAIQEEVTVTVIIGGRVYSQAHLIPAGSTAKQRLGVAHKLFLAVGNEAHKELTAEELS